MKRVAVRELKARLSEYLAQAEAGEEVVVTHRGRPIARLVPIFSSEGLPERLKEMEKLGLMRLGSGQLDEEFWERPRVEDREGRALDALLREREEGR